MTPDEIDAFLREPHIADLATVRPDGSPHLAPVWYHFEDDRVMVLAEPSAVKIRNIRHDARVSLCMATHSEPYKYVVVQGTAEVSYDRVPELLLTMAIHYKGRDEGERYAERTLKETSFCTITVRPSKIIGWAEEE